MYKRNRSFPFPSVRRKSTDFRTIEVQTSTLPSLGPETTTHIIITVERIHHFKNTCIYIIVHVHAYVHFYIAV